MKNLWLISAIPKHRSVVEASFAYEKESIALGKTLAISDTKKRF